MLPINFISKFELFQITLLLALCCSLLLSCHLDNTVGAGRVESVTSKIKIDSLPLGLRIDSLYLIISGGGRTDTLRYSGETKEWKPDALSERAFDSKIPYILFSNDTRIAEDTLLADPNSQDLISLMPKLNSDSVNLAFTKMSQKLLWLDEEKMTLDFASMDLQSEPVLTVKLLTGAPANLVYTWQISSITANNTLSIKGNSFSLNSLISTEGSFFVRLLASTDRASDLALWAMKVSNSAGAKSLLKDSLFYKNFGFAYVGKPFHVEFPVKDSTEIKWFIRSGEITLAEGTGALDFTAQDSLLNKTLLVQANFTGPNDKRSNLEWDLKIIGTPAHQRIKSIVRTKNPQEIIGSFERRYYSSRADLPDSTVIFDSTLEAGARVQSTVYRYNTEGKIAQIEVKQSGKTVSDSLFTYAGTGTLSKREIIQAGTSVIDSFFYVGSNLSLSKRYSSGALEQIMRYKFIAGELIEDSTFIWQNNSEKIFRIAKYKYQKGEIHSIQTLVYKGQLEPYQYEEFDYNASGLASYRLYKEGNQRVLIFSIISGFDASNGLLQSKTYRDEELKISRLYEAFSFEPIPAKVAAKVAGLNALSLDNPLSKSLTSKVSYAKDFLKPEELFKVTKLQN